MRRAQKPIWPLFLRIKVKTTLVSPSTHSPHFFHNFPIFLAMKTIWARLSQPAILPCDLGPDGQPPDEERRNLLLEWRRNGTLIFNAYGDEPGYSAAEYQGRLGRADSPLGLTIHSVRAEDQNIYICSITQFPRGTTAGAKEHGKMVRLIVHSFPRIFEPLNGAQFFFPRNGTAQLECLTEGIPNPSVRWRRKLEKGEMVDVQEGPSLEIGDFSADKQGEYICEAENFEGKVVARIDMKIKRPLRIDRQNPSLSNKTALEGASVFWHCSVEEQGMEKWGVEMRWSKNGMPISGMEVGLRAHLKEGEFGILRLRKGDTGDYACEATSSSAGQKKKDGGGGGASGIFEHDRIVVHLDVQYKPEVSSIKTRRFYTLVSGSAANLECFVEANPVPAVVKWTKNGRELQDHFEQINNENVLVSRVRIQSASLNADAGIYTCEAENSVGASSPFEINVVVANAPEFTKMPAPIYRVNAGDQLEVQCEGFAEVPLRKMWTKNGNPYELTSPRFLLRNVAHDDHGVYRCILVNSIVSVFKEFQIIVENTRPQCATHARVDCLGQNGFSLSWTPGYAGANLTQLFRIFYRKVVDSKKIGRKWDGEEGGDGWRLGEMTNHAKYRLEGLEGFAEYEMELEASNKFGQINCSVPGKHHTCSKVPTPANFRLDFMDGQLRRSPILMWEGVAAASKYKVKYRQMKGGGGGTSGENGGAAYRELAELAGTEFALPLERLNLNGTSGNVVGGEFVVQAVRPPFLGSDPTEPVLYPPIAYHPLPSTALLLSLLFAGGLFAILFLLLLVIFIKKHGKSRRNIFVEKQRNCCGEADGGDEKKGQQQNQHNNFVENSNFNSSRCPSSSTFTSAGQHCPHGFGHSVAITRKLFPDNYICTKLAQFDEEFGDELEKESFEQFPGSENAFLGACNGSSVSANFMEMHSEPNWPIGGGEIDASKSSSYMEMMPASSQERGASAVDEMLRDKYIFGGGTEAGLDQMEERRIEQLRRELVERCGSMA